MRRRRYTEEQIIRLLKESAAADLGQVPVAAASETDRYARSPATSTRSSLVVYLSR
jgi:hypothetical protein